MPANIWESSSTAGNPVSTFHVESDRRDLYCDPLIKYLVPEATPLLHILNEIGTESVDSLEFYCYDSIPGARWTTVDGQHADDDTTITIDGTNAEEIAKPYDLLKVPSTGEVMLVTDVPTASTYTVTREVGREVISEVAIGGTAKAIIESGATLVRIGSALAEGQDPLESRSRQPLKIYNYIQTFSDTIEITEDNEGEKKKTNESERQRLRREIMFKQRVDIATSMLLNERNEIISDKRRLMGGLLYFIQSKSYDVSTENGGYLTWSQLMNFCEELFQYGSKNKLLMTSTMVINIINQMAEARFVTAPGDTTYGLDLQQLITPFGKLKLAYSQAFEHDYAGLGLGVDLENIKMKTFGGNWLKLRQNIQAVRSHKAEDELYTQCGLELRLEPSHAILTGVEH